MTKNNKGQIIVFALLSIFSLTLFWIMTINIAKLIRDRIVLQNAADSAAQTASCIRARALNFIGSLNFNLGLLLAIPEFCWWPHYECNNGYHWNSSDKLAKLYEKTVNAIIKSQIDINKSYGGGWAYLEANKVAKNIGADKIYPLNKSEEPFSLKLQRNKGDIWYWNSFNCGATLLQHYHFGPVPDFFNINKKTNTSRWYQQSKDFYKKKLIIIAEKKYEKSWFPLARNLLGIKPPVIYAISASRPYNKYGPMFPPETDHWINFKLKTKNIEIFGYKFDVVPEKIEIDFGGKAGLSASQAWLDGVGGPYNLLSGKYGGWDAQLVDVGKPFLH